jgi:GT2 family glycosyltransferase
VHERTDGEGGAFTIVTCTRNRPSMLANTLTALEHQSQPDFRIVVVDQSDHRDPGLDEKAASDSRLTLIRDAGRGLSRARNIGWRSCDSDWIVFLDDDCVPDEDWARELGRALDAHPEASFVSGRVDVSEMPVEDYPPIAGFEVGEAQVLRGRWLRPWAIGVGACMAVRRSMVEALGGFDERLGAGAAHFPASDDMDFNYRFLRSGGIAFVTPAARIVHDQWRTTDDVGPHYRGYMAGWCGFAMKHLREGDIAGGLWLWYWGAVDLLRMLASAVRRRSLLRLRVAWWKLRGLVSGTVKGLTSSW